MSTATANWPSYYARRDAEIDARGNALLCREAERLLPRLTERDQAAMRAEMAPPCDGLMELVAVAQGIEAAGVTPVVDTLTVLSAARTHGDTRANLEAELMRRGYSIDEAAQTAAKWAQDYEDMEGEPPWPAT